MITTVHKIEELIILLKKDFNSIGLVPTMGNLHQGHLSLLQRSVKENSLSVLTIFVNPKQFGPHEDFDNYPRTLKEDIQSIKELNLTKDVLIFAPSSDDMFPPDFKTSIIVEDLSEDLCGRDRPGHFNGVTTVVYRLFSLIKPTRAYFGLKDYQQYLLIKKMTEDLILPVEIIGSQIIRDVDGLALSSRNNLLKEGEKKLALHLSKTLKKIEKIIISNGLRAAKKMIDDELRSNPSWDYLKVLRADDLKIPSDEDLSSLIVAGAYKIRKTRLIDNIVIKND